MSKIVVTAAVVVGVLVFNHLFCDRAFTTSTAAPTAPSSKEGESVKEPITAELKRLQKLATESRRKMLEARELAKSARKRGDKEAEERHFKDAVVYDASTKCLNKEKARVIFDDKNKGQYEGIVDLRDLDVEHAVDYAKRELQSATRRPNKVVHFIVGKDSHAKDAKEKIRPAVEELCTKRRLSFSPDAANSGILTVQC